MWSAWRGRYVGSAVDRSLCDQCGQRRLDGYVFFFSSRRRHTRFDCDWSSDVCSSDLTTEPDDVVLDPYMGAGTVAVVARDLGRHYVGAEIDRKYHEVALHRLSGEPDAKGNFPNLKTLRQYAERRGTEDLGRFSFTMQSGKIATTTDRSRIYPESAHLESLEEALEVES